MSADGAQKAAPAGSRLGGWCAMTGPRRTVAIVAVFAALSLILELLFLWGARVIPNISFGPQPLYAILASYSPAFAAVITALIFREDIRAFGWEAGKGK